MASGGVVSPADPIRVPQYSGEEIRAAVSGGAGRQRRFYDIAGMDALLRELAQLTAA